VPARTGRNSLYWQRSRSQRTEKRTPLPQTSPHLFLKNRKMCSYRIIAVYTSMLRLNFFNLFNIRNSVCTLCCGDYSVILIDSDVQLMR
jgi:hypothetical protein